MSEKRKPPRLWTKDEDAILRNAIAKYDSGSIDWQEVATHLKGRTNKDCRKRWVHALRIEVTKGPWSNEEDKRLEAGVGLHGCKWNKVSEVVGTRQADQCSRRWHECRNPTISRSRWSLWEDNVLENAVRIYGRNWTEIVERFFPERTPISAKNRYKQRFEKATGAGASKGSQDHDRSASDGKEPSSTSSTSPSSWSEPWDEFTTYSHVPDGYSPSSNIHAATPSVTGDENGWAFASLSHSPAVSSATDMAPVAMYGHPGETIGDGCFTHHDRGLISGSLDHLTVPDLRDPSHELYAASFPGGFGVPDTIGTSRSYEQRAATTSVASYAMLDTWLPNSTIGASTLDGYLYPDSFTGSQTSNHMAMY
ncbi:Homeodomain-like protein [Rhypophila decipiens]|uniref:Homeodomain-like protein n=1 Tax=Rhypophila decipiens TaxID=261697 RepID=A0AAN6Y4P4_9PEZI|nr:Homeodomain-like protein [Rhypophila decipiens]